MERTRRVLKRTTAPKRTAKPKRNVAQRPTTFKAADAAEAMRHTQQLTKLTRRAQPKPTLDVIRARDIEAHAQRIENLVQRSMHWKTRGVTHEKLAEKLGYSAYTVAAIHKLLDKQRVVMHKEYRVNREWWVERGKLVMCGGKVLVYCPPDYVPPAPENDAAVEHAVETVRKRRKRTVKVEDDNNTHTFRRTK